MSSPATTARRRRLASTLLDLALLGHTHWLCGNLYEAVVKIPQRLAAEHAATAGTDQHSTSLFGPGSPVRYYVPAAPLTFAATLAALVTSGHTPADRRWLAVAVGCSAGAAATTAYLIRRVNLRIFYSADPPSPAEREHLIRIWYRVNTLRIATTGGALLAGYRAGSGDRDRL